MALYLTRFSYTPQTWDRLTRNPEDRRDAARGYIESVGGKLHGFWYAFGSHDGFNLWEAPDNVSMAAVANRDWRRWRCVKVRDDATAYGRGNTGGYGVSKNSWLSIARSVGVGLAPIQFGMPLGQKRSLVAFAT